MRKWLLITLAIILLAFNLWASDFIMLQGERTVYTAECYAGIWNGEHCNGQLVSGKRYHFRALTGLLEVPFWIGSEIEPATTLKGCVVRDGSNWYCSATTNATFFVPYEMVRGKLIIRTAPLQHQISKIQWLIIFDA